MELIEYLKFSTGQEKADIDNYKLGECYDLIQEFIDFDRKEQLRIGGVSNRRELLMAFALYVVNEPTKSIDDLVIDFDNEYESH